MKHITFSFRSKLRSKIAARHFLEEKLRIGDMEIVGAEGARPHDAEVRIAHHHGIGSAPFVPGKKARVEIIHVGLEG